MQLYQTEGEKTKKLYFKNHELEFYERLAYIFPKILLNDKYY